MAVDALSTLLGGLPVKEAFDVEIDKLDASNPQGTCMGLAAMCMLITHAPQQLSASLPKAVVRVTELLSTDDSGVQNNALAVLSAALSADEASWQRAVASDLADRLLKQLATSSSAPSLQLNLITTLTALAQGGEAGARQIMDGSGVGLLLPLCRSGGDSQLLEASVDLLCQLAVNESCRDELRDAGAVQVLGALLGDGSSEVRVRALMGLGMLVTKHERSQGELAATPGALHNLLVLMRQDEDMDCKVTARDLISLLARSPAIKEQIAETMRSTPLVTITI